VVVAAAAVPVPVVVVPEHFEKGMALYQKAPAIDPNNINTHEYIGEGY
jgi:hypothetical protein